MRIPRIYQHRSLSRHDTFLLDEIATRHLMVLRLSEQDKLILFNGEGQEFEAYIKKIKRNAIEVTIAEVIDKNVESNLNIHLGQAISKGDRMDLTLQKATELGVCEITPLFSTRSEVHLKGEREQKKLNHWQKVIISSCEQCGRNRIPTLHPPMDIHQWIKNCQQGSKLMLDHRSEQRLKNISLSESIFLLVGPEGGLTFEEKLFANQNEFIGIHLGPRILRTETAAMVAITALQLQIGDL